MYLWKNVSLKGIKKIHRLYVYDFDDNSHGLTRDGYFPMKIYTKTEFFTWKKLFEMYKNKIILYFSKYKKEPVDLIREKVITEILGAK